MIFIHYYPWLSVIMQNSLTYSKIRQKLWLWSIFMMLSCWICLILMLQIMKVQMLPEQMLFITILENVKVGSMWYRPQGISLSLCVCFWTYDPEVCRSYSQFQLGLNLIILVASQRSHISSHGIFLTFCIKSGIDNIRKITGL